MFVFENIFALGALALLPLVWLLSRFIQKRRQPALRFSDIGHLKKAPVTLAIRARRALIFLRLLVLALLIVAAARPQYGITERITYTQGIDIYLCLDVSGSMQARDFLPNRLEAAKRVLNQFVEGRANDRIGVIVFATTSFTLIPLTLDYRVIQDFVARVSFGIVDENRTAIGSALANAVKKLQDSEAESKVVVLLTDGESNAGSISPDMATEAARALGVKVYTIGVGSRERVATGPFALLSRGGEFDEKTLRHIADRTGGKYFHATNEKSLENIFKEIDQLETTTLRAPQYVNYSEQMAWFVWPALILLLMEIALGYTKLMKLP